MLSAAEGRTDGHLVWAEGKIMPEEVVVSLAGSDPRGGT